MPQVLCPGGWLSRDGPGKFQLWLQHTSSPLRAWSPTRILGQTSQCLGLGLKEATRPLHLLKPEQLCHLGRWPSPVCPRTFLSAFLAPRDEYLWAESPSVQR